jgi:hypothetical protein
LVSFPRIFPDLTGRAQFPSEFAFQLTAKEFARLAITDCDGNAASFWKAERCFALIAICNEFRTPTRCYLPCVSRVWIEHPFVIPSKVEESLAIQEIIRDVSTSLDMTEMYCVFLRVFMLGSVMIE